MLNKLTEKELKWARNIWIFFWYIIWVHFFAQLFSFLFLPYPAQAREFYIDVLILPTIFMSVTVSLAWVIVKFSQKYTFHALYIAATVVAVMIIRLNTDIRIISALLLLPILSSVIFFRIRLTLFSAALQVLGFILLYFVDPSYRGYLSAFDVIAIPCFLGLCTLIATIIMIRGRELREELFAAMIAKQDLMIQYAIMQKQAKFDSLTNLYNQASFYEHFELALKYGDDHRSSFHLALIDIDNFKTINDTFGHRVGDLVLSGVARIIKETIPANDIAARYGGEEFAILLFEADFEDAVKLLDSIRAAVSGTSFEELDGTPVTISIGISSYKPSLNKESLFEQADKNLYKAKRSGKNRIAT
ncbi:GGDEF domain-containing protein [Paenibacillus sp. TAB 01]|uniref:GGDEF domain-containing protein n=1 Tax=Paenibacillus sp. TAB 01 TaxID=3368988 RepID=UPI003751E991